MKKLILLMLALVMVLSLAACGDDDAASQGGQQITLSTQAPEENQDNVQESTGGVETANGPVVGEGVFSFNWEGVEIIPGEPFDASKLPAAASTYTVPSCALEGTDNVYNYETFEVTAYDEGSGEYVYSIYLIDANLATAEGLALGDDLAKVIDTYGEDYAQDGTAYVYYRTNTLLSIIVENETVVSIEYRLAD